MDSMDNMGEMDEVDPVDSREPAPVQTSRRARAPSRH
jgi:hypothetical protein